MEGGELVVLVLLCREAKGAERREGITELMLCLHTKGNGPEELGTLMM